MKNFKINYLLALPLLMCACDFVDVVPDNIPTEDMIYNMRANAEKQLNTCYGSIPQHASPLQNPGLECGDEIWNCKENTLYYANTITYNINRNNQNTNNPYMNFWSGGNGGDNLFVGIRECNSLLENVDRVPDMTNQEKNRWKAEVKVIKAYLHYWLLQLYGPIPFIEKNIHVSASPEEMQVVREPVDDVVAKIVALIDDATKDEALPAYILVPENEMGRLTRPAALAIKAKVLLLAASPLFNGNEEYANFKNAEGVHLINQTKSVDKWVAATTACEQAILAAEAAGHELYEFNEDIRFPISDATKQELTIRNTITSRFNKELIWGLGVNYSETLMSISNAVFTAHQQANAFWSLSMHSPTLQIAEMYYTDKGVPIKEDKTWDYDHRYEVADVPEEGHSYYIEANARTARLHYYREPRFYACLGFDRGKWFNMEPGSEASAFVVKNRVGEISGKVHDHFCITGYFAKKLVNYRMILSQTSNTVQECTYAFPIIRLADLYLMYAEALNETMAAPDAEVIKYVQKVRTKAGLDKVTGGLVETWATYSDQPDKPASQEGMREIIHQERLIELAMEGHRFYDIRRWKKGMDYWNKPIQGWTVDGSEEADYYTVKTIYQRKFTPKEYLWPIGLNELYKNKNLVQNPMWDK